jgi:hypothetical protein
MTIRVDVSDEESLDSAHCLACCAVIDFDLNGMWLM